MGMQAVAALGEFVLVCRDNFAAQHAYLVAETLTEHGRTLSVPIAGHTAGTALPIHPGALAYYNGESLPDGAG